MLAVSIKNLSHKINNKSVLNNVNFELKKDSIACILGPSGSGKTTLLKLIAGLDKVQNGHILINDQEVSSAKKHLPTEKRRIGFLFQDYALFPHLTVKENLELANNILKKYPEGRKKSVFQKRKDIPLNKKTAAQKMKRKRMGKAMNRSIIIPMNITKNNILYNYEIC